MSCQALDHEEILSIRWAHDDPNPIAKQSIERADKDALVSILQGKGVSLEPASFEYPSDYQLPEAKRLRIEEGGDALEQYPELSYPNTDHQYYTNTTNTTTGGTISNSSELQNNNSSGHSYVVSDTYYAQQAALSRLGILNTDIDDNKDNIIVSITNNNKSDRTQNNNNTNSTSTTTSNEEEVGVEWYTYKDESTGKPYYYNTTTKTTTWIQPPELKYQLS